MTRFKGEHTEKVTLKKRDVTYNSLNEQVEDWDSNDESIFAEFFARHGKEGEEGGQVLVIQDTRCKIRYKSGLDPTENSSPEADYRIERGNVTYDIESIVMEGRNKTMKLMLKRRD